MKKQIVETILFAIENGIMDAKRAWAETSDAGQQAEYRRLIRLMQSWYDQLRDETGHVWGSTTA